MKSSVPHRPLRCYAANSGFTADAMQPESMTLNNTAPLSIKISLTTPGETR